jgi:outer membrane protein assembly factor BamB
LGKLGRWWLVLVVGLAGLLVACGSQPTGWSGPVLYERTLFVGTNHGKVIALDPTTQQVRWQYPPDDKTLGGVYANVLVIGQTVYIAAYDGKIYAVNAADGSTRWQAQPNIGHVASDMVAVGDVIYLGAARGLVALDAISGRLKWLFDGGLPATSAYWSSPAVSNGIIFVGAPEKALFAVRDAGDRAEPIWRADLGGAVLARPLVVEGTVYVGTFDRRFLALDAATGARKWQFEGAGNWYWSNPIFHDGVIYAANLDHKLYALEAATGTKRWEFATNGFIRAAPVLVREANLIVIANSERRVYAVDLNGNLKWEFDARAPVYASLAAAGNEVYVVNNANTLYALDATSGVQRWEVKLVK